VALKAAALWSFDCEGKELSGGKIEIEVTVTAAGDWLETALSVVARDEVVDGSIDAVATGASEEEKLAVLERVGDTDD
jgi:hypothetical protein